MNQARRFAATCHSVVAASAREFVRDRDGAILILSCLLLTVFVGAAAFAVDVGRMQMTRAALQAAADAAALAGASQLPDSANVANQAIAFARRNLPVSPNGNVLAVADVERGNWNSSTGVFTPGGTINAVRATARRAAANSNALPLTFAKIFGYSTKNLSASAVAVGGGVGNGCVLGLDPTANQTVLLENGAHLSSTTCGVYSNSSAPSAIECQNGARIDGSASAVGAIVTGNGANCGQSKTTGAGAVSDPYSSVADPSTCSGGASVSVGNGGSQAISVGDYCGGIVVQNGGTLAMGPGVYNIGTAFSFANGSTLNATGGVTLVFTGNTAVTIGNGGRLNITAPSSGSTAGIAMMGPRSGTTSCAVVQDFQNGSTVAIQGAMYFPCQHVTFENGSTIASTQCTQIIADKVDFKNGATSLSSDCASVGGKSIGGGGKLRLVH